MMGLVKDASGSFAYGLLALAAMVLIGAAIVLGVNHDRRLEVVPAT
jgi:hypothetical protein